MFVKQLMRELFNLEPGTYQDNYSRADDYYISRKALVDYFVEKLGLKKGNKVRQQVDIPIWVKMNESYLKACIRGLIDTDGSVFTHKYRVKGKEYRYKKLSFTSASQPLKTSVYKYLKSLQLNPRLGGDRDVRLDSQANIARYFNVVGSHNPKHLKRYAS